MSRCIGYFYFTGCWTYNIHLEGRISVDFGLNYIYYNKQCFYSIALTHFTHFTDDVSHLSISICVFTWEENLRWK